MAVISMDATDRATRVPRQRSASQDGNAVASRHVETGKTPTELGYLLTRLMGEVDVRPYRLARVAGFGGSTLNRIIFGEVKNPDPTTLDTIAKALVAIRRQKAGLPADGEGVADEVAALFGQLMTTAGYQLGMPAEPRRMHPKAVELDQWIGEGSPLSAEEIDFLVKAVDRLMKSYGPKVRKRTS